MMFDYNLPGVPQLGGTYPQANDLYASTLALMGEGDGMRAFYKHFFIKENHDEIFR